MACVFFILLLKGSSLHYVYDNDWSKSDMHWTVVLWWPSTKLVFRIG